MKPRYSPAASGGAQPAVVGRAPARAVARPGAAVGEMAVSLGPARLALWALVAAALVAVGYRMVAGLGASTHLSDVWPWGLWKIVGVVVAIPLAAGAFVVAAWVHVFRHHGYEALARPAVLAGFIGYLTAVASLVVDIGQPHRIWHPIVMWQPHSVLFEICWCVILYTTVLALEFSPVALRALGWERPRRALEAAIVPLAVAGATLCVLHQSSLGSLFLIAPGRVHPLWYTPALPLIFFVSSVAAGLATLQILTWVTGRLYGQAVGERLKAGLARGLTVVLGLLLAVRVVDWAARGAGPWQATGLEAAMAWLELLVGIALPLVLLAWEWRSGGIRWRLLAAVLAAGGVFLHRLDVGLISMRQAANGAGYFPSWMEFLVMAGIVALGMLAYDWVARRLPLFERS